VSDNETRKLAAIMFTDMVGYSALSQRNDKLAQELLEEHRQLLREIFPRFHGTEVKTIGDAFLVEFNSALEAAQCAIEIQRALAKRNADAPAERQIEIRIGIHIGDVVHRAGDVYGDGVNIASRIEQLANAGGICVSMDVERQIRNALEARFEKLAPTELKNISVPMDLFRIVLPWERLGTPEAKSGTQQTPAMRRVVATGIALFVILTIGIGWWWSEQTRRSAPRRNPSPARIEAAAASVDQKSIAVLPFENLSHDPENAYFAEGVRDELLARLSKVGGLKVTSIRSTQQAAGLLNDRPAIAHKFGVTNVLEGSVQRSRDQVRVNVQLIKAENDAHLWADSFDRKLTDIFAVESEIAKAIAGTLQAKLTGSEQNAIAARPTENTEAYQFYLKGRFFWNKRASEDLKKAADYFNQAIATDPKYALAYVGLADTYVIMPFYAAGAPEDCYPKAQAAAKKALAFDDTLAEAHASLAYILQVYDLDFDGSEKEFQRAIELNPNYATAHHWYGIVLLAPLGRFDQAILELKRALELDPLSLPINASLGRTYYLARRYNEAIEQLRKTLEMNPGFYYAHWNLGSALVAKGATGEAIGEYEKARALSDDPLVLGLLGRAYASSGNTIEAEKILNQLNELSTKRYVPAYSLALVYLGLGNKAETLRWIEKSYEDHADLVYFKVEPLLDPLRGDPRFEALVQRVFAPKKAAPDSRQSSP
jgi:adenylate cyclase